MVEGHVPERGWGFKSPFAHYRAWSVTRSFGSSRSGRDRDHDWAGRLGGSAMELWGGGHRGVLPIASCHAITPMAWRTPATDLARRVMGLPGGRGSPIELRE